jgi:hypothetical protein
MMGMMGGHPHAFPNGAHPPQPTYRKPWNSNPNAPSFTPAESYVSPDYAPYPTQAQAPVAPEPEAVSVEAVPDASPPVPVVQGSSTTAPEADHNLADALSLLQLNGAAPEATSA